MYVSRFLTALVLSASAGPALGDGLALAQSTNLRRAQKLFREGVQASQAGEYNRAIDRFKSAYDLAPRRSRPAILFNIAVIEDSRPDNCEPAQKALERFLEECKQTCRDRKLGEARLSHLKKRCQIPIALDSTPTGARVYLNGEEQGITPLTATASPGEVQLKFTLEGYIPLNEQVTVREGQPVNLNYTLRQKVQHGRVRLVNVDPEVSITLDDQPLGPEALVGTAVPVGEHILALTVESTQRRYTVTLDIRQGTTTTVDVRAQRSIFERVEIPRAATYTFWSSTAITAIAAGVGTGFLVASQDAIRQYNDTAIPSEREDLRDRFNTQESVAIAAFASAGVSAAVAIGSWLWPTIARKK